MVKSPQSGRKIQANAKAQAFDPMAYSGFYDIYNHYRSLITSI